MVGQEERYVVEHRVLVFPENTDIKICCLQSCVCVGGICAHQD